MNLLWLSGRVIGRDMAGTTEEHLCMNLEKLGNKIVLISPGDIQDSTFEHISVERIGIQGMETLSAARNIRKVLNRGKERFAIFDALLVDWRFVRMLRSDLNSLGIPWIVVDRGPPATSGIIGNRIRRELLRNIQKIYWRSAWKEAKKYAIGGFVVSKRHRLLINDNHAEKNLYILPAGSERNKFLGPKGKPSELLKIAYVGRIDKKRGLEGIMKFSDELDLLGIKHHISLAGEGDMQEEFAKSCGRRFSNLGRIGQEEVMELLAGQHVGLLPMPNLPIWRIASPLKLAEYLASGLALVGPSHPGNKMEKSGKWNLLSKNNWWVRSAKKIEDSIQNRDWEKEIVEPAIESSRSLLWEKIALQMSIDIELMKAEL